MPDELTIAIDGPAGSGKSTAGLRIASELGFLYVDTGAMYRAVTLAALQRGLDPSDEMGVSELAERVVIELRRPSVEDGRQCDVLLNGVDVTWAIRSAEVDALVSVVSAYAGVRRAMTARQREIGLQGRVVMVGRDIGTVVMPDADVKIYLDASPEERARRRYLEQAGRGQPGSMDEIYQSILERDRIDSGREHAPLRPAPDATTIDTTGLSLDEVVRRALDLVRIKRSAGHRMGSAEPSVPTDGIRRAVPGGAAAEPVGFSGKLEPYDHGRWEARRRVLRWLLSQIGFRLLLKVERVDGLENLPAVGPAILMINHIAFVDPIVVLGCVPRNIVPLAKEEVLHYPLIGLLPHLWGVIPIRRGEVDRQALLRALQVLQAGEVILVAPEGTRSPRLRRGREGVAYLAHQSGAPVVPVAIDGTEGFPSLSPARRRRPGAVIRLGRPFRFRRFEGRPSREQMRRMADEAMYVLARMLAEDRRGYYSDLSAATAHTLDFA